MIDSAVLVWGGSHVVNHRSARSPFDRTQLPLYLNFPDLVGRLGSDEGEVRTIRYGDEVYSYGHWKRGTVEVLYGEKNARLELRGSLPKIVAGENTALLGQAGVHEGLRKMVAIGGELIGRPLDIREAAPARLDYVYQWDVPSVAHVLEHMRAAFRPGRTEKLRTENVSPLFGGRSLVWGYGGKRVLRWYDKGAECAERAYRVGEREPLGLAPAALDGLTVKEQKRVVDRARRRARELAAGKLEALGYSLDSLLRFEIQERRRDRLQPVHHFGYTAHAAELELEQGLGALAAVAHRDLDAILGGVGRRSILPTLGCLWIVDNELSWPVVRRHMSRSTFYRARGRGRELAFAVADWSPSFPEEPFGVNTSLWSEPHVAAA